MLFDHINLWQSAEYKVLFFSGRIRDQLTTSNHHTPQPYIRSNMSTSINSLPFELVSQILIHAAVLNQQDSPIFSYGLSARSGLQVDCNLRGHIVPDLVRSRATQAIRQVSRQWHDWACQYAFQDLYITRWRGSERYVRTASKLGSMPMYLLTHRKMGAIPNP